MTDKAGRLKRLASQFPSLVPTSVRSARELQSSDHSGRWWARTDTTAADQRQSVTRAQAAALLAEPNVVEVQPYIAALASGAVVVNRTITVAESTPGGARGLFRMGLAGQVRILGEQDQMLYSHASPAPGLMWDELSTPMMPIIRQCRDRNMCCIVEWILDESRRLWLVDLKEFPSLYVGVFEDGDGTWIAISPTELASGPAPWATSDSAWRTFATTALEAVAGADVANSRFMQGGVLSHAATMLVAQGAACAVQVKNFHKASSSNCSGDTFLK